MLGYAERTGRTAVFARKPDDSWEHKGSQLRITDWFPNIPVREDLASLNWCVIREQQENAFTYMPVPDFPGEHVFLEGFFQSEKYGPAVLANPPSTLSLPAGLESQDWSKTFFFHVRRGDYLHPANAHHAVDLSDYYRQAFARMPEGSQCFVVSDDMPWCRENLPTLLASEEAAKHWCWCPEDATDVEAFAAMIRCELGGICANSTFSWWAAFFQRQRTVSQRAVYMPRVWGKPPLPEVRDLHPVWATVI
jgi:hypothetical protein